MPVPSVGRVFLNNQFLRNCPLGIRDLIVLKINTRRLSKPSLELRCGKFRVDGPLVQHAGFRPTLGPAGQLATVCHDITPHRFLETLISTLWRMKFRVVQVWLYFK